MLLFKSSQPNSEAKTKQILHLEEFVVPIHIYIEKRNGSRISMLKEKINIRLPNYLSREKQQKEITKLLAWARARLKKKNIYLEKSQLRNYWKERCLIINQEEWAINFVEQASQKNVKASLITEKHVVEIVGPFNMMKENEINELTKQLLIDLFKRHFRFETIKLVSQINDLTLKKQYNKVSLKYINSRWGSCSTKGNINISLRLFFAPKEVMEYVILHELCHLEMMNHSAKFWNLVAQHMPNYKIHERWLKENGHLCDF